MSFKILAKRLKRLIVDDSKPIDDIHDYWTAPNDSDNKPTEYLTRYEKSEYLFSKIKSLPRDAKILEVGTNVGRNLNYLYKQGFTDLNGVEISQNAVDIMKVEYPEMYENSKINLTSIEDFFNSNETKFDLIYSLAVLEHVHTDSDWIFEKMSKATSEIITIEDEKSISWKHFPRNYKKIFEAHNMNQIDFEDCKDVPFLHRGFYYRRFKNA